MVSKLRSPPLRRVIDEPQHRSLNNQRDDKSFDLRLAYLDETLLDSWKVKSWQKPKGKIACHLTKQLLIR